MRKIIKKDYKNLSKKLYEFYNLKSKMPTFEEMKNIFQVSSKDTVYRIVKDLINLEYVNSDKTGKLIPVSNKALKKVFKTKFSRTINLLGTVEAGFPSFVEVGDFDTITLDEWLLGDRSATFILKVKGDSMTDAGILNGDFVVVERGKEPKIGDIVLAEVDKQWTLKYFRKDKQGIFLEPANKNFKIIRPTESLEIPAVVVSVIRKYGK